MAYIFHISKPSERVSCRSFASRLMCATGSYAMSEIIYKITPREAWDQALKAGEFAGAPIDVQDGYIHFSSAAQVVETALKHFAGQKDLMLIAIEGARLGDALKWEPSRGGALFPHLYGPLPMDAVLSARPLPLGPDGAHVFPDEVRP